jgi:hypothetical protein
MQPRTKWIVTVFIGLLLVGVAGRLHDTAGPSPVKEIPAYSGVARRKRAEPSRGVAATRLYAVSIPLSFLYGATRRG